jgi:hypothetical protein
VFVDNRGVGFVVSRCFLAVPPLFFGLIFPQAIPQHESFRGRGRALPLFFPGITAITADRRAGRHITGVAFADPD